jgi:hypothetical protein
LQEVSLHSTLESIGERAFYRCLGLKHIKIPAGSFLFDEVFGNSGLEFVDRRSAGNHMDKQRQQHNIGSQ